MKALFFFACNLPCSYLQLRPPNPHVALIRIVLRFERGSIANTLCASHCYPSVLGVAMSPLPIGLCPYLLILSAEYPLAHFFAARGRWKSDRVLLARYFHVLEGLVSAEPHCSR